MKKVIVIGAKLAPDVADIISDINSFHHRKLYFCAGALDDDASLWGKSLSGIKVLGGLEKARKFKKNYFVSIIGGPASFRKKKELLEKIGIPLKRYISLVHPAAHVARTAKIGQDVVLYPGVVVWTGTEIGNHVFVAANSVIGEGSVIGDYSSILLSVTVSGFVRVGQSVLLANGSVVKNRVNIGEKSMVGLGSVVFNDVPAGHTVIGNPARSIKKI